MSDMADADVEIIVSFLVEKFDLKSKEQIKQLSCRTFGFASRQFRFLLSTNEGKDLNLFVKKVSTVKIDANKEIAMYETLIPEIMQFVKLISEDLANALQSCFIKCYMSHHTTNENQEPLHYLVLEDFTSREGDFKFRDVPQLVAELLGVIHGSFLAWQRSKHPGLTPAEMLEKYPFLTECYTAETGDLNEGFFIWQTLAVDKIIRVDEEFSAAPDKLAVLEKLGRLVKLCPHLSRLRHETQKPRQQFFCPTLADVHGGNIAMSESEKDILFFDFDIIRISSPLIDFHHFTAGSLRCSPHDKPAIVDNLLMIYIDSFLSTCHALNCDAKKSELLDEYKLTHNWYTITSYFVPLLTLEIQGVSNEDEEKFFKEIINLDVDTESDKIREIVANIGNPVKVYKENVLKFLRSVEPGQLDKLEKQVIELKLNVSA